MNAVIKYSGKMDAPIVSARFYGHSLDRTYDELDQRIEERRKKQKLEPINHIYETRPRSVFEPSPYKKEFWKQCEALVDVAENSCDDDLLHCFVFQDENQRRRFVVTYPEDLWMDCENLPLERRVFYEVIPEYSPCFLYYDLEFETNINEGKDGIQMTRTLIDITCDYINKFWSYSCNRNMVINLDSSRTGKFSKHLIFSTKDVAFENNSHVGQLVKMLSTDIVNFLSSENEEHDILSTYNKADLEELFVETNKGKKLFVDLNVYTKNRHFRIYKATKFGQNSHLTVASDNEYKWNQKPKNKDLEIFLNSLVAYLPSKKKLRLLSFDESKKAQMQTYSQNAEKRFIHSMNNKEYAKSPYPVLDKYINDFIKPGKIRDSRFIESCKLILFEIVGYRYCENIGRQHKSNNIYYVVDLKQKIMYQKCHDEDCAGFISLPKQLPEKVSFYFEDELDSVLSTIVA